MGRIQIFGIVLDGKKISVLHPQKDITLCILTFFYFMLPVFWHDNQETKIKKKNTSIKTETKFSTL